MTQPAIIRKIKGMLTVAVQGRPASFHYQAARNFFAGQEITVKGFDTFTETFEAVANANADYAVVALENSIHGTINDTYDLLREHHLWINSEQYLHIGQCLITLPGVALQDITEVYTHFAALSQCRQYLETNLPYATRHVHPDTAGAVADIKKWGDPHKAAIASAFAAEYYRMPVLARNIETDHHNYTRFALLSREQKIPKDATKTTLLLQLHGTTGALHKTLGILAAHNLDLTMLTSRPVVGSPGTYQFFIDVASGSEAANFIAAANDIKAQGHYIRVLGSYLPLNTLEQVTVE